MSEAGTNLTKGGNVSLSRAAVTLRTVSVCLGWDVPARVGPDLDLDASAIATGPDRRVLSDKHFVFFNNIATPDRSIVHSGDDRTGAGTGDNEVIDVNLARLAPAITNVFFAVSIYAASERAQTFGQVSNAYIRVVDTSTGAELTRYNLREQASSETAMVFGELYRRGDEWKFRAIGQGYASGLAGIARDYGVGVESDSEPATESVDTTGSDNRGGDDQVGDDADEISAARREVEKQETLESAAPGQHTADLGYALIRLAMAQGEAGLPHAQRAVELFETHASPAETAGSARASAATGWCLAQAGRSAESLAPTERSVRQFEELANVDPARYRPGLAAGYHNLGRRLAEVGRTAEALAYAERATGLYEKLMKDDPNIDLMDVVRSLLSVQDRLVDLERDEDAVPVAQRAVEVCERLAAAEPNHYRGEFATTLSDYAARLFAVGRAPESIAPMQRAVQLLEEHATAEPTADRRELWAVTSTNLGLHLGQVGRFEEALAPSQRAIAIVEQLAHTEPDKYAVLLAQTVGNLANAFTGLGRPQDSLPLS